MPPSPERRLAMKVAATADKLNHLFMKANKIGLVVDLQVDTKQLKFPMIAVNLLKPVDLKPKNGGRSNPCPK